MLADECHSSFVRYQPISIVTLRYSSFCLLSSTFSFLIGLLYQADITQNISTASNPGTLGVILKNFKVALRLIMFSLLTIVCHTLLSQDFIHRYISNSSLSKNLLIECWTFDSTKQTEYFKRINLNNGFLLFKVEMINSKGDVAKYMVYNNDLQVYLKSKQITNRDSINNYIMEVITGHKQIPITDSIYVHVFLVNQFELDELNSTPIKQILNKYFDDKGIFKDKLYDNSFLALSCFMFEHAIIFGYPYSEGTARIDNYYIYKLRETGCWTR